MNSIIIRNWGGETKEIVIPKTNDYSFEVEKEYFLITKSRKVKRLF